MGFVLWTPEGKRGHTRVVCAGPDVVGGLHPECLHISEYGKTKHPASSPIRLRLKEISMQVGLWEKGEKNR